MTLETPGEAGHDAQLDREAERTERLERAIERLTLGPVVDPDDPKAIEAWLDAAGVFPEDRAAIIRSGIERLSIYRELVQGNIYEAIQLAMPRAIHRMGEELFDEYLARWLSERGPRTHYLRDVTLEFLGYCKVLWAEDPRIPSYLFELARHEAMRIEIASMGSAHERRLPEEDQELALDRAVVFIEAIRLVRYQHAVHRLSAELESTEAAAEEAVQLLVYRSPEHEIRYLELTPMAAAICEELFTGKTLQAALLDASARLKLPLEQSVLEGTARLLADLAERGALLGSRIVEEPNPAAQSEA